MDLEKVTSALPILSRLGRKEKDDVIHHYISVLNKKPLQRVQSLLRLMEGKRDAAAKGTTIYHKVLQDQYNRIANVIRYSLSQRPLDKNSIY